MVLPQELCPLREIIRNILLETCEEESSRWLPERTKLPNLFHISKMNSDQAEICQPPEDFGKIPTK